MGGENEKLLCLRWIPGALPQTPEFNAFAPGSVVVIPAAGLALGSLSSVAHPRPVSPKCV